MADWIVSERTVPMDRPRILGIVNVTPDSFSDGGRFFSVEAAVNQGLELARQGADILDVGGESTRPHTTPVDAATEQERILPVIKELRRRLPAMPISVDTVKASVASAALEAGADIVNDVSGLRLDPRIGEICAEHRAGVVLMHSRGEVSDMATFQHANYGVDVAREVLSELRSRVDAAMDAGVAPTCIAVDPGIGFSKRAEHSLAVLAALPELASWGFPVMVGPSRKRFIGDITGVEEPAARVAGTIGAGVVALVSGARLFRVHDVRPVRQALDVAWAVMNGSTGA